MHLAANHQAVEMAILCRNTQGKRPRRRSIRYRQRDRYLSFCYSRLRQAAVNQGRTGGPTALVCEGSGYWPSMLMPATLAAGLACAPRSFPTACLPHQRLVDPRLELSWVLHGRPNECALIGATSEQLRGRVGAALLAAGVRRRRGSDRLRGIETCSA